MPRVVVMLQRRSAQVAALSPVQWADTAPVPRKLDLHPHAPTSACASVCKYSKYCDWMHTEGPIAADLSAEQVLKGWH